MARARQVRRLTSLDRMFLHLETPDWPGHFGGLAVVDSKPLLGDAQKLRFVEMLEHINSRLPRVPHLRRRLFFPGPLGGPPLWVDDENFDLHNHVHESAIAPPGNQAQLLDAAAQIYSTLLDRRRPLWELWFLTGLSDGSVGVLLKLHHSVADGMAAITILSSLLDLEPDARDPAPETWAPEPAIPWRTLVVDNFWTKVRTVGRSATNLAHPRRLIRRARIRIRVAREAIGQVKAPRTSLNQVVRYGRRIRFIDVDLAAMKRAAHSSEAKLNDVVLDVWAGGLRALMLHRGESTSGVELITNVPVSLRSSADPAAGNEVGFLTLPLPVREPEVLTRLDLIVRITRKAKADQQSAAMADFLALGSALPMGKYLVAHQSTVNLKATNIIGPPAPVYLFGARVLEILPITRLFGNVGLTLAALSYAGRMYLVMTADATAFPDLDVLMSGMSRDCETLLSDQGAAGPNRRLLAIQAS